MMVVVVVVVVVVLMGTVMVLLLIIMTMLAVVMMMTMMMMVILDSVCVRLCGSGGGVCREKGPARARVYERRGVWVGYSCRGG